LQINAIKLNPGNPLHGLLDGNHLFTVITLILSFPTIRNYVRDDFLNILKQFGKPDVIAGVTLSDRNWILVAESLGAFVYVRPEAKNTGVKTK
jgi:orotate phosphoribosyltransferase